MGCDIHLYVEKRVDGNWRTADKWSDDKYEEGRKEVAYDDRFYSGRNYDLFSILANVRNGRGFAGVKTGEGFVPISEPRGVPDDACEEYKREAELWGCDGHSHSYLTLQEILSCDWTQTTQHQGYVSLPEWARWRGQGKPESWCGMVGGGAVKIVDRELVATELEKLKVGVWDLVHDRGDALSKLTEALGGGSVYTLVDWTEAYHLSCTHFWSHTVPRLLQVGPPEDVRLVFFFDN